MATHQRRDTASSHSSSSLYLCIVFLLAISSTFPTPTLSAISPRSRCNPADKRVLLQIKKSINNPHHFHSWNSTLPCCDWDYVLCNDYTHRVVQLNFYGIQTHFQIPAAIGELPYLRFLNFAGLPNLTGTIPYSFTKLQNLESLIIRRTTLSCPIPDFLGQLKNLRQLILSYNQLSGHIPASLGYLNKLALLDLRWNKLNGNIPDSFGSFNFDDGMGFMLDLSHNQLAGEIPKSMGALNFTSIDLSHNKLVGDASVLFRENTAARSIYLYNNRLDFDLTKVWFPRNINYLDLSHNRIHGSIPNQVIELDLQSMDLSYNRLCGKIPFGGNVQQLGAKSFAHNQCLCGPPLPTKCK
nr:TPA_asm: hypothetical protein HUJ06_031391 [Nelumbo nucifera]